MTLILEWLKQCLMINELCWQGGDDDWVNIKFVEWEPKAKWAFHTFFNCVASITKASTHFLDGFH